MHYCVNFKRQKYGHCIHTVSIAYKKVIIIGYRIGPISVHPDCESYLIEVRDTEQKRLESTIIKNPVGNSNEKWMSTLSYMGPTTVFKTLCSQKYVIAVITFNPFICTSHFPGLKRTEKEQLWFPENSLPVIEQSRQQVLSARSAKKI